MAQQGIIVGSLLRVWGLFVVLWQGSAAGNLWRRFAAAFGARVDGSLIIGALRADWDKAVRRDGMATSASTRLALVGRAAREGGGSLAERLRGSVLLWIMCDRLEFTLICLMAFAIPFLPTMLLAALGAAIFALYVVNLLLGRHEAAAPGLCGLALMGFALCYALSTLTSFTFPGSVKVLAVFLALMGVVPSACKCVNSSRRVDILSTALIFAGVLVSLYGIYQYVSGVAIDDAWVDSENYAELTSRAYATFGNPNVLGEFLIVADSVCFGMLWKSRNQFMKFVYLGSAGVMSLCLYCTGSRGAMLGLAFAAFIFVVLQERRLLPLMLLGLAAVPFIMPAGMMARFMGALNMTDSSSLYRMSIYQASIDIIENYWLTGIGVDAFNQIYPQFSLAAANSYHAHNLFLQVFIELGLPGFVFFVLSLVFFFQRLYRGKCLAPRAHAFLITAVFGGFAGLLLHGMADNIWFNYRIVALFWLTVGLGLACAEVRE